MGNTSVLAWSLLVVWLCVASTERSVVGVVDAQPTTPGFIISLSQGGLDYIEQVGLPIVVNLVQNVNVGTLSGSVGSPIGTIDYDLSNIIIQSIDVSSANFTITDSGLSGVVSDLTANIHLDWHYREHAWPHASDSGDADVTAKGTTVSIALGVYNTGGYPQLQVQSCSVHIGDLDIDLHGGQSWLYQIFVDAFSSQITSAVQGALSGAIGDAISSSGNKALMTLPMSEPIEPGVEINYELIGNPSFSANTYVNLPGLGEFYDTNNPTEAPYTPGNITMVPSSSMLQMFVDNYVFNTAGYVFFEEGQLKTNLVPSDVPSDFPIQLNTSDFCLLVSNLCKMYPDYPMALTLYANAAPVFSADELMISVYVNGTIDVFVINASNDWIPTFSLNAQIYLNGTAAVSANNLVGSLSYLHGDFELLTSEIGNINVGLLQTILNIMFYKGIIPQVNKLLANGFTLPTLYGISLVNPSVGYADNFLIVNTDFVYNP
eukprot:TRINITY_DN2539_c0_g1_i1.p1 TRINITY_DN2539_c0_g1~~TRINITY_DN2539_c0_g1_i1.p1  ORF type:complete len:520 (-),score=77.36 TRINITY_DN2539_c0_g1_i1:87-1553(-)